MQQYEYRCRKCGQVYMLMLDPCKDDTWHPLCGCGGVGDRTKASFASIGYIDWVNPNHGDGINLGLGRHFKSSKEREDWAKRNGYEKLER